MNNVDRYIIHKSLLFIIRALFLIYRSTANARYALKDLADVDTLGNELKDWNDGKLG